MRFFIFSMLVMILLDGCTVKEFGDGVDDGVNDVKRVIRGNN